MKLQDIIITEAPASSLKTQLARLEQELEELKNRAKGAPQYADQVKRLRTAIKVKHEEITAAEQAANSPDVHPDTQTAHASAAAKLAAKKESEKKDPEFGDKVAEGMEKWKELRQKHGGESGLIAAIKSKAKELVAAGSGKLKVAELANHFDVPVRTMYKWLERDDFKYVRRHQ